MPRETRLATAVVELARTLVEEFDILDFLQTTTTRTSEVLGSSAMLLLTDQRGALQLVAISPPEPDASTFLRVATGAVVACLGTSATRETVEVSRLRPDVADAAADLGVDRVEVVPLRIAGEDLGALVLLGAPSGPHEELAVLEAFGGLATLGLLQQRSPRRRELLAEQLQTALTLRIVLEQATGMVAEMAGVSVDAAFRLLEGHAHRTARPLSVVVQAVVDGRLDASDLTGGPTTSAEA